MEIIDVGSESAQYLIIMISQTMRIISSQGTGLDTSKLVNCNDRIACGGDRQSVIKYGWV